MKRRKIVEFTFTTRDGARHRQLVVTYHDAELRVREVRDDGTPGATLDISYKKLRELLDTVAATRES